MSSIVVYSAITGEIKRLITCPPSMKSDQLQTDELYIEGIANSQEQYVLSGNIVSRPSQSTTLSKLTLNADGIDEIIISNAPIGATCTFKNSETISGLIDGTDNFRTTIEGVYTMTISLWPYLVYTAVINAV